MLLVYTSKLTSRIEYIFQLLLHDLVGIEIGFSEDEKEFIHYEGAKLNYSMHPLKDELFFKQVSLLVETDIKEQVLSVFEWERTKAFFPVFDGELPFDAFSASFYLVSRYEEYFKQDKDIFGRFQPEQSCAFQNDFLQQPVVNLYAKKIKEIICNRFPYLETRSSFYQYLPTIDIDNAYAYKGKGILRIVGAYFKALTSFRLHEIYKRTMVLLNLQNDPYDTYATLTDIHEQYQLTPIYFVLTGNYAKYDKNLSVKSEIFQSLIHSIAKQNEIGIHPSFESHQKIEQLNKEYASISDLSQKIITKSRQHFIQLNFPETYRNLITAGITDDYTMGYPSKIGFRAGICSPFYYYDLLLETKTSLKVYPFAVMDTTLKYYLKISSDDVINYLSPLIKEIKKVQGTFISIWHNESLSNKHPWKGWENVYGKVVHLAMTEDTAIL